MAKFTKIISDFPVVKNNIVIGSIITNVLKNAANSLFIAFILAKGTNVLNVYSIAVMLIGIISAKMIGSEKITSITTERWGWNLSNVAYKKFRIFMHIEGVSNIICAVIAVATGNVVFALIFSAALQPFEKIQALGCNIVKAKSLTSEDRKSLDDFNTLYGEWLGLIGLGFGIILNAICSPAVGFAIYVSAEAINNVFYLKAYREISANPVEAKETEEEDEEAEPVSV